VIKGRTGGWMALGTRNKFGASIFEPIVNYFGIKYPELMTKLATLLRLFGGAQ